MTKIDHFRAMTSSFSLFFGDDFIIFAIFGDDVIIFAIFGDDVIKIRNRAREFFW